MKTLLLCLATSFYLHAACADNRLLLGQFSNNSLEGWESKCFKDETVYQLQTIDGVTALKADSRATASGLFREQPIDLEKTPYLNWSWRIDKRLQGLNEQHKTGDDYAARVYVLVKGGLAFWQSKAINYVWAGSSPKDSVWPNAYVGEDTMMMVALRGPEAPVSSWQTEKRNIREDLHKMFGEDIKTLDAIAVMTDSDDSRQQVSAYYGDIWFSKD